MLTLKEFIAKLRDGQATNEEWQQYMVTHYFDCNDESARVACVRLLRNNTEDWPAIRDNKSIRISLSEILELYTQ